ncbi:MAG TPA: hypothetical protein VHM30_04070, partial [Gemmatimonadaceae bacterium]|nr:hypothetical protein [Gemmatimonadaceae bacterium]
MTRITRPFFVAAALLLATSPALAQKVANKRAVDRAIDIYDPTLRGSQQTRDRNAGANDRDDDDDDRFDRDDDDDRYEHDRYEHDRDYNGDGPGNRGRGHAYGHEKQKGRKGVKCYDRNYDSICDDAQTTSRGRTDCAYDARTGRCTYGDVYSRN